MPREFKIPHFYRSPIIQTAKDAHSQSGSLAPAVLDFGVLRFKLARRFGFCFGVQNAVEMIYRIIEENPGKRIFLVSEMIHNPAVNADLARRGVAFLLGNEGEVLVDISQLSAEDIVIVPAFGSTLELQRALLSRGIDIRHYDTTCPFVKKVWKRAAALGEQGFTVIIHGKRLHEETKATFSHSQNVAPTLVIRDLKEAALVCDTISGKVSAEDFSRSFAGCYSPDFRIPDSLQRLGIVNQTTMLASETQAIAELFRRTMGQVFGKENLAEHFADTRDTLCYATYENQRAATELTKSGADLALVVGGYNSSNTAHLVELCQESLPTYFIKDESEVLDRLNIRHFDPRLKTMNQTSPWLPELRDRPLEIAVTAGASCPDSTVEAVIFAVAGLFAEARSEPSLS